MATIAGAVMYRSVEIGDAPALAALSKRLGGGETADRWEAFLERPTTVAVAAVDDLGVVGYAAGDVRIAFGMPAPAAWVEAFGVDLGWRARGVGWALAQELLGRFRLAGATYVYTVVPLHDRVLAPFFREIGFRDELLACLGRAL